ncbi:hypothetical protein [Streptomyces sp. CA-106110]|uniref:hypothetical protein n=1 Tax=Streptomyces sp. CA-106110 TaxID=3240044 RepID=UPI003D8B2571
MEVAAVGGGGERAPDQHAARDQCRLGPGEGAPFARVHAVLGIDRRPRPVVLAPLLPALRTTRAVARLLPGLLLPGLLLPGLLLNRPVALLRPGLRELAVSLLLPRLRPVAQLGPGLLNRPVPRLGPRLLELAVPLLHPRLLSRPVAQLRPGLHLTVSLFRPRLLLNRPVARLLQLPVALLPTWLLNRPIARLLDRPVALLCPRLLNPALALPGPPLLRLPVALLPTWLLNRPIARLLDRPVALLCPRLLNPALALPGPPLLRLPVALLPTWLLNRPIARLLDRPVALLCPRLLNPALALPGPPLLRLPVALLPTWLLNRPIARLLKRPVTQLRPRLLNPALGLPDPPLLRLPVALLSALGLWLGHRLLASLRPGLAFCLLAPGHRPLLLTSPAIGAVPAHAERRAPWLDVAAGPHRTPPVDAPLRVAARQGGNVADGATVRDPGHTAVQDGGGVTGPDGIAVDPVEPDPAVLEALGSGLDEVGWGAARHGTGDRDGDRATGHRGVRGDLRGGFGGGRRGHETHGGTGQSGGGQDTGTAAHAGDSFDGFLRGTPVVPQEPMTARPATTRARPGPIRATGTAGRVTGGARGRDLSDPRSTHRLASGGRSHTGPRRRTPGLLVGGAA